MIVSGGVALIEQPAFIRGKQAEYIVTAEKVSYKASPKVILGALLRKAAGINRHLYAAASVGAFDAARAEAQGTHDAPDSADADYVAAAEALRAAIDGLVRATFTTSQMSLLTSIGHTVQFVVTYNGIDTVKYSSANPSAAVISATGLVMGMGRGSAQITASVQAFSNIVRIVSVS